MSNFGFIFRALRNRNYRLFFLGQTISLIGTWMQQMAMSWLVYRLSNSAFLLGVVGFSGQIPTFLLAPLAGVIADRYNQRRILVITQVLASVQAVGLTALILTHTVAIWHLIALSIFLGLVNAFDIPVRQAFTVTMIEKREDLGNAIALNSSMVNAARLLGPSIGGILISFAGEGVCFLLNALSYGAVIASLLMMKITFQKTKPADTNIFHELKEGFGYAFGFTPIKYILMLLALISFMGVPYQVLMPIFARDIFHAGPQVLGFLMASSGLGALIGALYLASRKSVLGLGKIIALAAGFFGFGIIAFSFSRILWLSLFLVLVSGFAMMVEMASSNIVLQTICEEDKRGRIMSFYTMAFMGMAPFGSLFAGSLAGTIGAPYTLVLGGSCCIIGAGIFSLKLPFLRQKIHPIYAAKGIIPEVAKGIQSATTLEIFSKD